MLSNKYSLRSYAHLDMRIYLKKKKITIVHIAVKVKLLNKFEPMIVPQLESSDFQTGNT